MKSLQTVQKTANVLKIFASIVYICGIIGFGLSLLATITVGVWGNDEALKDLFISMGEDFDYNLLLCNCLMLTVECGFMAVLYFYVRRFYVRELIAGTPFDKNIVKETKNIGILHLVLPLAATVICAIIAACFKVDIAISNLGGVCIGVTYLILSAVFNYGAELKQQTEAETPSDAPTYYDPFDDIH